MMEKTIHIVGIGGLPRSGKDSLAELFVQAGYYGVSLGDIVRDVSRQRHADSADPISVAHMTETANWLRQAKGADFALQEALNRFEQAQASGGQCLGLVVWSVRAPVEADFIRSKGGELIWLESSDEVRHKRALQHQRAGEIATTLEEFKRQESLQWQPQPGIPQEAQMDIAYVKQQATRRFSNDSDDLEGFRNQAEKTLGLS